MDNRSRWTRQRRRNVAGLLVALAVILLLVPLVLPDGALGAGGEAAPEAALGVGGLRVDATLPPDATLELTPAPAPADGAPEPAPDPAAEPAAEPGREWTAHRIPDLPVPLDAAAVVDHDGEVWSIGGRAPDAPRPALTDVFVFDPATGAWSRGPSLPQPISHAAAVVADGELFVVGALSTSEVPGTTTLRRVPLTTVLRLEVGHDGLTRWVHGPPLPVPTAGGAAAWDGRRIVYGGWVVGDGRAFTSAVWALRDGRWTEIGRLAQARADLAAASDGQGRVWFMGGRNDSLSPQQVNTVDRATDQGVFPLVSDIAPTQGAAGVMWPGVGPCLVGGHGVPVGSEEPTYLDRVQCPNVRPGEGMPTLTEPRALAGAAVLDGEVYVIGGEGRGFTGSGISEALRPPAN